MIVQLSPSFFRSELRRACSQYLKNKFAISLFEIGKGLKEGNFQHQEEPCLTVLFDNGEGSEVDFHSVVLPLGLAVGHRWMEGGGETLLDDQNFDVKTEPLSLSIESGKSWCLNIMLRITSASPGASIVTLTGWSCTILWVGQRWQVSSHSWRLSNSWKLATSSPNPWKDLPIAVSELTETAGHRTIYVGRPELSFDRRYEEERLKERIPEASRHLQVIQDVFVMEPASGFFLVEIQQFFQGRLTIRKKKKWGRQRQGRGPGNGGNSWGRVGN